MNYTTATRSLTLLHNCPDDQLRRLRAKSDAYITRGGDRLDAQVNKSIRRVCRERGV